MTQPLNVMALPLHGQHLIEASAGTGKTWTIACLYVRLVLGLDSPQLGPLWPRNILVLTFTRAATQELVDRIRSRLVQAHLILQGTAAPDPEDGFLQAVAARYPHGPERAQAAWLLRQAANRMDEAAVMTIDAWVQRLLSEHLLPVGQSTPERLLESDEPWLARVVRDYWREEVYPLDGIAMEAVADYAAEPKALQAILKDGMRLARAGAAPLAPKESLQQAIAAEAQHRAQTLSRLKSHWIHRVDDIRSWFDTKLQADASLFSRNILRDGIVTVDGWCDQIRRWCQGRSVWLEGVNLGSARLQRIRLRLTPEGLINLHKAAARPKSPDELPAWASEIESLIRELDAITQAPSVLRSHALGWVWHRLALVKRHGRAWTFDDLLGQAFDGLQASPCATSALRAQYPVAMVDECQDTSPAQLRLLRCVYPEESFGGKPCCFVLIGDPKQSIYRFRGADIHGYLQARAQFSDRLHFLDCNHRSVPALVESVNHLFSRAEQSSLEGDPGGAFMHGADVPFLRINSKKPKETLVRHKEKMPALWVWTEAQSCGPGLGRRRDAHRAASQMARMLRDPSVGFTDAQGRFRRLRPQDFCVLVRNGTQAEAIRRALADQGLASVYLSERDSVLQSPQARDLLNLLLAMRRPRDLARARRVWASASMGLELGCLLAERDDDALWDARIKRLAAASTRWSSHGVLAAVRDFVRQQGLAQRALASSAGQRGLANWLHLAEWLQSLAETHRHPDELVRAFAAILAEPKQALESVDGLRDDTLLRLESDTQVVQVVTIHKSKGLQYPIVWIPFGSVAGRQDSTDPDEAAGDPSLDTRREDMRLLYVALTRAVHQVWLGACPRKPNPNHRQNWHLTALGNLISGQQAIREDLQVVSDLRAALDPLVRQGWASLEVLDPESEQLCGDWVEDAAKTLEQPAAPGADLRAARRILHPLSARWRVESYTALVRGAGGHVPDWRELRWDEESLVVPAVPEVSALLPPLEISPAAWHQLDSSAELGQLLHELLELGAAHRFSLDTASGWLGALRARVEASSWSSEARTIEDWLSRMVELRGLPGNLSLSEVRGAQAELEFWMPLDAVDTQALDRLLAQHILPGHARPPLRPQAVEGLLMGFADLVFEHEGRYEVLDYKSNRLGLNASGYTLDSMRRAVLEHRYDVQAALYLLALHRMLKQRLGSAYNPPVHLGAAHFYFVRGVDKPDGAPLFAIPAEMSWLDPLDRLISEPVASPV